MGLVYDLTVQCDSCDDLVELEPPRFRYGLGLSLAFLLGILGFGTGLTFGVATAGFGMTAMPFTTIIGGYVGYRFGGWGARILSGITCPECGHDHSSFLGL